MRIFLRMYVAVTSKELRITRSHFLALVNDASFITREEFLEIPCRSPFLLKKERITVQQQKKLKPLGTAVAFLKRVKRSSYRTRYVCLCAVGFCPAAVAMLLLERLINRDAAVSLVAFGKAVA